MVSIHHKRVHLSTKPSFPNSLMTVDEVAAGLRVDSTTVRRWIKNGTLPAISLPHKGERQAYRIKRTVYEQIVPPE